MRFNRTADVLRSLGWPEAGDKEERVRLLTSLDLHGCGFITRADLAWLDGYEAPEWICAEPDSVAWEQLKELLLNVYGHLLMAWRKSLDKDGSNRISWEEFASCCNKVGFKGNAAGAWCKLDQDFSGYISMKEFDLPSFQLLTSFKEWTIRNFGSAALCIKALDADRSGSVTIFELKRATEKFPWHGDVRLLFKCLNGEKDGSSAVRDSNTGRKAITIEDVAFLDAWNRTLEDTDATQETQSNELDARMRPGTAPSLVSGLSDLPAPAVEEFPQTDVAGGDHGLFCTPARGPDGQTGPEANGSREVVSTKSAATEPRPIATRSSHVHRCARVQTAAHTTSSDASRRVLSASRTGPLPDAAPALRGARISAGEMRRTRSEGRRLQRAGSSGSPASWLLEQRRIGGRAGFIPTKGTVPITFDTEDSWIWYHHRVPAALNAQGVSGDRS
jgi:hypothetical protein